MKNWNCLTFTALLCTSFFLSGAANAANSLLKSEAFARKTGQLVYREEYRIQADAAGMIQVLDVKYMNPDGSVFAEMHSDFSKDPFAPDSQFTDKRFDITEVASLDKDMRVITIERTRQGKKKTVHLSPEGNFISGQGFNNYFMKFFDPLLTGEKLKVRFVVLDQQDDFGFNAFMAKSDDKTATFTVQLSNWALRQLVSPIVVVYDKSNRQLRRFEGLSNLLNEKEDEWDVRIEYSDLIKQPDVPPHISKANQ